MGYQLAVSEESYIRQIRDNVVVSIAPSTDVDRRERATSTGITATRSTRRYDGGENCGGPLVTGAADRVRKEVESLGLAATAVNGAPAVETMDVSLPRPAADTTWSNTEKVGSGAARLRSLGRPVRSHPQRPREPGTCDSGHIAPTSSQSGSRWFSLTATIHMAMPALRLASGRICSNLSRRICRGVSHRRAPPPPRATTRRGRRRAIRR